MKKTRKSTKPEKVTFEAVAHFLPEDYFELYDSPEANESMRKEFESRIRRANRTVGTKTARELNYRSTKYQRAFVELQEFAQNSPDRFEQLCEEIRIADSLKTKSDREAAYSKISAKYKELPYKYWGINVLELCKSLKPFHTYSELL